MTADGGEWRAQLVRGIGHEAAQTGLGGRARVLAAGRPLLVAAQESREIRDDLTLEQILDMVIAVSAIRGDSGYLEPILQAAFEGLRPATGAAPDGSDRHSGPARESPR